MTQTAALLLLVEDNTSDAFLLKKFLGEKPSSPSVFHVTDGEQALDYLLQRNNYYHAARPGAVLLDLGLPRVTGYELLKHIKNNIDVADIPVFILTTSRDPADQMQCRALGAVGYYSKPNDLQGYRDLIRQLSMAEFFPGNTASSTAEKTG